MTLPISHVMRSALVCCEESSAIRHVAEKLLQEKVGSILVNKGEETVGIITTTDIIKAALSGRDFDTTTAAQVMSTPVDSCESEQQLDEALKKFQETGRSRLVVKKDEKVVGVIKKSIAERFKGLAGAYKFSPTTRSLPFRRGSGSTQS